MQQADKKFLTYLTGFVLLLLFAEWLKSGPFLHKHHGVMIAAKTGLVIFGSVVLMYINLNKPDFIRFCWYFGLIWGLYFLMAFSFKLGVQQGWMTQVMTTRWIQNVNDIVQLQTPVPILIYWLVNKVINRTPTETS